MAGADPQWTMADRLKKARLLTGLEQEPFADLVGMVRGTVSNYETGKTKPRRIYLEKIAEVTGVTVHWLLTGEEAPLARDPDDWMDEDSEGRKTA